jgi:hypothetical protein
MGKKETHSHHLQQARKNRCKVQLLGLRLKDLNNNKQQSTNIIASCSGCAVSLSCMSSPNNLASMLFFDNLSTIDSASRQLASSYYQY